MSSLMLAVRYGRRGFGSCRFSNIYIRYDQRGCGLSDWAVPSPSFEARLSDLEAVVDTLGLKRFALFGISQDGALAIAYAARHPQRLSHLVLLGACASGALCRDGTAAAA